MIRQTFLIAAVIGSAFALSPALGAEPHPEMDHKSDHQMDLCGMPSGEGVINALDVKKSKISISHKAIASIGYEAMTMDFAVLKPVDLTAYAKGERVHFLLKKGKENSYSIAAMCSLDIDEGAQSACMAQMHNVAMTAADDAGQPCSMEDMGGMDHGSMPGMDHGAMKGKMKDGAEAPKEDHSGHH